MTEEELKSFLTAKDLIGDTASLHRLKGGYLNSVWRVDTENHKLIAKQFATPMTGTLFPNLPEDEAEALRRLAGLDVAPTLVDFFPNASLLVYEYVAGDPWRTDAAAVANLLLRKECADPSGFRSVPLSADDILSQGDALFARCDQTPIAARPSPIQVPSLEKLSLIHTDIGVNLVGEGTELRLIDWQCPAAGDICEDIYSFLSPAFQILGERAPLNEDQIVEFWSALNRPDLADRYAALRSSYAWRFAGYCAWRAEVLEDVKIRARYAQALDAELAYVRQPA